MVAVTEKAETAQSEQLLLDMVDKFLATEVQPHVRALERDDVYPTEIVEKMKGDGLVWMRYRSGIWRTWSIGVHPRKIIERISSPDQQGARYYPDDGDYRRVVVAPARQRAGSPGQ
jgi:hypothetical protein